MFSMDEVHAMTQHADRCRIFRQLHQSGCFVVPDRWDLGSARLLEQLGFRALATTSSGFAWSLGRPDNHVSLEVTLAHLRTISQGDLVPGRADFCAPAARTKMMQGPLGIGRAHG